METKYTTHLEVAKEIVPLLSKSTYQRSFSNAIRELVSNAYDADALSVYITIDDNYKKISIEDDGNGMTQDEFNNYLRIAGQKSEKEITRRYKRKRIGKFGVGFLSIFPFCNVLKITTTSENSNEILVATIPSGEFFKPGSEQDVEQIPIEVLVYNNPKEKQKHYTIIELNNPTYFVKQYFSKIKTRKRESNITWEPFEKFIWELGEDLPVSYVQNSKFTKILPYDEPIGLSVFVNKKPIFRNEQCNLVLDKGTLEYEDIICEYFFTTDYKSILPLEARGIKIRVNNVGIGKRTDFNITRDRGYSRLHWINGEMLFSPNIKEHLNLNRDWFISSSKIDQLLELIGERLKNAAYLVEDISIAETALLNLADDRKSKLVKPRSEIFHENLGKLISKGFKLENTHAKNESNIIVDKDKRKVFVNNNYDLDDEKIKMFGKKFSISYDQWENELIPCRFVEKNIIAVNRDYPLFRSKSYGNIFKRIHILLLIAESESRTAKEMLNKLLENFLNEFKDFQ